MPDPVMGPDRQLKAPLGKNFPLGSVISYTLYAVAAKPEFASPHVHEHRLVGNPGPGSDR